MQSAGVRAAGQPTPYNGAESGRRSNSSGSRDVVAAVAGAGAGADAGVGAVAAGVAGPRWEGTAHEKVTWHKRHEADHKDRMGLKTDHGAVHGVGLNIDCLFAPAACLAESGRRVDGRLQVRSQSTQMPVPLLRRCCTSAAPLLRLACPPSAAPGPSQRISIVCQCPRASQPAL